MDIGFEVEMAFADGHGAAIDVTDGRIIAGEEVRHDDLRKNALDFEGGEEGDDGLAIAGGVNFEVEKVIGEGIDGQKEISEIAFALVLFEEGDLDEFLVDADRAAEVKCTENLRPMLNRVGDQGELAKDRALGNAEELGDRAVGAMERHDQAQHEAGLGETLLVEKM